MKVYIGPYTNWIGPYQIAEKILFWMNDEDDRVTKLGDMLAKSWVGKLCNWIDSKKKRKIKIHIDNYDLWGMDNTLAHIIHPMLVKMRDQKQGVPFTDDEDVPEHIRSTAAKPKENDWDTDEFHDARWEYILGEMIHAFECEIDDEWEEKFYSGKADYRFEKWDEGSGYEMKEGPNHTFKVDRDGMKKAWERRQEGLRLFGKYYHSLWT